MILLYLFICTLFAAFFAGLETGLLSANRILLQEKKEKGILYARASEHLLSKPERLLGTTLIGYNIANITAAVLFTNFLVNIGWEHLVWVGVLFMTFFLLIFNDLVPKSFLRQHADNISVKMAPMLLLFFFLFQPLYIVLNTLVKILLLISGQHVNRREELKSKRDVRFLVNLAGKEVGLPPSDQRIIEDIFDFRDQSAHEVMIPFHLLPAAPMNQDLGEIARLSHDTGYRFIPVYTGRIDNIVGYVDIHMIIWNKDASFKEVMKEAVYYPETRLISDLLLEMNRKKLDVVFLSDEYGGIAGMITPGQIIGDLVHYIPEEGSVEEDIQKIGAGHFAVSATTDIEDLGRDLGIILKRGYNTTIGGYIAEKLGVIPDEGKSYEEAGWVFKITRRDTRHILELEVMKKGET